MDAFIKPMHEIEEFLQIDKKLKTNAGVIQVTGCIDSQKSHMVYSLGNGFDKKIIATFSEVKAKEIFDDYRFFDKNVLLYPTKDVIFFQSDIHGNLITRQRMNVIKTIIENEKCTIITTIDAFMDNLININYIKSQIIEVNLYDVINMDELKKNLVKMGYENNYQVEMPGQFSIRGGIIDIYPLTDENPIRIELFDDEIDTIRVFDAMSQRSIENLESVKIYPAREVIPDKEVIENGLKAIEKEAKKINKKFKEEMLTEEAYRIKSTTDEMIEAFREFGVIPNIDSYIKYFYSDTVSLLDYFDWNKTLLFIDEPARIEEKCRVVEKEFTDSMQSRLKKGYILPGQADVLFSSKKTIAMINSKNTVALSTLDMSLNEWDIKFKYNIPAQSISPYNNSFDMLVNDLKRYKKSGSRVILVSASVSRAKRLATDLMDFGLNSFYSDDLNHEVKPGEIMTVFGNLKKGFEYKIINFAVISESDIFGSTVKKKRKKKVRYEGQKILSFTDLHVGDYVVHENHGLGIYRGIEKVEVDKVLKDYIKIEYSNNGFLYIQATQLESLQKYANADAKKPKLNKLGTVEWKKTKTRVKSAVWEVARDLVELYAARQDKEGYKYGPDTVWQHEFEEMFPFEETEDQLAAIEAAKRDMESTKIMDRLICGDVGYGKTEIAIRVAFKAVLEGKQVVYLVPTTILAQQHYNTFVQRMKDFPVKVDLLCRFRSPKEQKKTIEDLKKGAVDIVIGTHRVLSKDVEFKDLGLLIIDEEQRFGVKHKEQIKKMRNDIDVLTLSATPIPRTLHMSLVGIRDMSRLEEPPIDRMPIQTFVMEYDEEMVREAINREIARNGQVYYVYNRVNTIEDIAATLAKLVPEARIEYAHGQMKERQLESIMYDFINGDIDVLVSTTIIETGLDISNVNTIIIHDSDNMGLSQLYQLRGRVGRSNRNAYAYLLYRRDKMLKEVAKKRLHAIKEFTELGSGIKIAMRDLEIRGAGNILGEQQHGHMAAVGYDLYCKMLNEAVRTLKGEKVEENYETTIDLAIDAYIPDKYVENEFQKLDLYKRIAGIETEEEYDDILSEMIDRFGDPPKPVQNLMNIASLKAAAHSVYVVEIVQKSGIIKIIMYEKAKLDISLIPDIINKYRGNLKLVNCKTPYFEFKPESKDTLYELRTLFKEFTKMLSQ